MFSSGVTLPESENSAPRLLTDPDLLKDIGAVEPK